jgi:electron-transferring-flavoprotein dehydrogenase
VADALPERDRLSVDVVIVGAGPAGLAAAIRLKQLAPDLAVAVLEKGAEVGAHILSGAVIDPIGLDALVPEWRTEETPLRTPVTGESFLWLGPAGAVRLPTTLLPPMMRNHGCYVASLGEVCRWLAGKAEALGVDVFPGFAAVETLHGAAGAVVGVATGDKGVDRAGKPKPTFQRGIAIDAKYTLIAEGARGSLAKGLIARFGLDAGREPQKYGIGIKELWEVDPRAHRPGFVLHTLGWPLDNRTGGGSFLYHLDGNRVAIGFVVHLNYANPHLSPFDEFQRFKTHPAIAPILDGARRLEYGARAITEGGWQSVPKLTFPGGALVGCAAGFVNVPRIKGSHNAILSGMLAAEHVVAAIATGRVHEELDGYDAAWRTSPIGRDLRRVRNAKPLWSRLGTVPGIVVAGFDLWAGSLGLSLLGTLRHGKPDHAALRPAHAARPPREAFKPDGVTTFDRLTSVFVSGTRHEEDQPGHLRVRDLALQKASEHDVFGGPSARYCPAAVYEWLEEGGAVHYQINAANCVHCKTCDIKDPNQNIDWVPPEGGDGPNYRSM